MIAGASPFSSVSIVVRASAGAGHREGRQKGSSGGQTRVGEIDILSWKKPDSDCQNPRNHRGALDSGQHSRPGRQDFVVTGANSGLGLETTRELVRRGAKVIMAVRDPGRGRKALDELSAEQPKGALELRPSTSPTSTRCVPSPRRSSPTAHRWMCWSTTPG
ncbi:SDR family NAD(P)-dependent oxidoreductase [Streptosporangium lutulentum]